MAWACGTEISRSFSQCQLTSRLKCLTLLNICKRFLLSLCKLCTFKLVLMCAILVINYRVVYFCCISTVVCRATHLHNVIINHNDCMEWNTSVRPKWRQHSSNQLWTAIIVFAWVMSKLIYLNAVIECTMQRRSLNPITAKIRSFSKKNK